MVVHLEWADSAVVVDWALREAALLKEKTLPYLLAAWDEMCMYDNNLKLEPCPAVCLVHMASTHNNMAPGGDKTRGGGGLGTVGGGNPEAKKSHSLGGQQAH